MAVIRNTKMIKFKNLSEEIPFVQFKEKYNSALEAGQNIIEAIAISSYNCKTNEVDSRFVNLKFIDVNDFIFFSNYDSPKSQAFSTNSQISALIHWSSINVQIRMKAKISKTSKEYNKEYFSNRSKDKNALAISSMQSQKIKTYEDIQIKYEDTKKNKDLYKCPDYWGGFKFSPYYFEFWEGHPSRINKREAYEKIDGNWEKYFLEP